MFQSWRSKRRSIAFPFARPEKPRIADSAKRGRRVHWMSRYSSGCQLSERSTISCAGEPGGAETVNVRGHPPAELSKLVQAIELTFDVERVEHVERGERHRARILPFLASSSAFS